MFAPRLVTLHLPDRAAQSHEVLCTDELLVLVDELADAGVNAARFFVRDPHVADDSLRVIEHARRRKLAPVAALRGAADSSAIALLAEAGASTIAIPLHSHNATTHEAVEEHGDWGRSVHLANVVRDFGAALEIETRVTSINAVPLLPLLEVVDTLECARWRLDFHDMHSGVATTAATTLLLHAASRGGLQVIVHGLPQLRQAIETPVGDLPRPNLRCLTMIDAGEAMEISACGDIRIEGSACGFPANVRQMAIDAVYRLQTPLPPLSGRVEVYGSVLS